MQGQDQPGVELSDPIYLAALAGLGAAARGVLKSAPPKSIAVLPFANLSGEPDQEYFTDGLTEDVITDLSNAPELFVIAKNSTFAYKGKAQDIRRIAYDLGVKFILEGSVRKSAGRLRINVQLSDAEAGNQVWAERFDREISDIFALQDEVTARIVSKISGRLVQANSVKAAAPDVKAYDLFLRGRNQWGVSAAACTQARELLAQALVIDPNYAHAMSELGVVERCEWLIWGTGQDDSAASSNLLTRKAISLAPADSRVIYQRGWIALSQSLFEEAREHFSKSLAINPNDADAWMGAVDFYTLVGEHDQAVMASAKAFRLNPTPPALYYIVVGNALIGAGKHLEAVDLLSKDIDLHASARRFLAVALAQSGRLEEARVEADRFSSMNPNWRASSHVAKRAFKLDSDRAWWLKAYADAGLIV